MKQVLITVLKNAILVLTVVISIVSFWSGYLSWQDLIAVQIILGLVFVFLNCYEYLNASYKAEIPVKRFAYFPYSFFMLKIIKAGFFTSFALMLLTSGTKVKYLFPVCIIIAITELVVMILKYKRRLCFVSIYANYLLFSKNIIFRVFANEIECIEFRHGIFYIIKKDKKAVDIRLVNIENRDEFVKNLVDWMQKNDIQLSAETKLKIDELIVNFS